MRENELVPVEYYTYINIITIRVVFNSTLRAGNIVAAAHVENNLIFHYLTDFHFMYLYLPVLIQV